MSRTITHFKIQWLMKIWKDASESISYDVSIIFPFISYKELQWLKKPINNITIQRLLGHVLTKLPPDCVTTTPSDVTTSATLQLGDKVYTSSLFLPEITEREQVFILLLGK